MTAEKTNALSEQTEHLTENRSEVLKEQIRLLYKQTWSMLAVNMVVGAALVAGMWPAVPTLDLTLWYGYLVVVFVLRVIIYSSYERNASEHNLKLYSRLFTFGVFLSASAWASASVLFFQSGEFQYQLLIVFVLTGMGAGAVTSMYTYKPAFLVYFLTANTPIIFRLLLEQSHIHTILAGLFVLFIYALCFFASRINKTFLDALNIKFENISLVTKLREQKDEAEKANHSKSKFLAAASHDLRQPLHALNLYASILSGNIEKPQNKKLVGQITHSVEALQSLFNALLDISRLEAGTLVPERRNFRIEPVLERVVNDYEADARLKGIDLRIISSEIICYTDASLLEQILRNYISNAIRYTNSGEITISCHTEDGHVKISVSDTGIGIPEDQLDAIYGEFFQLRNPERDRSKGLGLGLAIVQRISNLLDHKIAVSSVCGEGSCFSVTIPSGSTSSYIDLPRASVEWMQNSSRKNINIVIIDDDADVRESTEALFASWGCSVYAGSTPQDVLEQLKKNNSIPDAVIADYRLRGGRTGIGAIDLIKSQYDDQIPALIITGDTASEPLQAIQNSGIPLLNKPVSPAKFRTFLNSIRKVEESA